MCGIIACLGTNVSLHIINGLKQLQNRGYDSAGISLIYENEYKLYKHVSSQHCNAIQQLEDTFYPISQNGIGHTRWATHGPKTYENSHPHMSYHKQFMLVHNGIIENYQQLKNFLIDKQYVFYSQTDSEVIVNLLEYYFYFEQNLEKSILKVCEHMNGTWGLCIQYIGQPNHLYVIKRGSPILIGNGGDFALVSSEPSGFCNKMTHYFELKSNDISVLSYKNNKVHIKTQHHYNLNAFVHEHYCLTPHPYKHWTFKEIMDQKKIVSCVTNQGGRYLENGTIQLGGLNQHKELLKHIEHIIFLGCGTSYFSSNIGAKYMKKWCNFTTVQVFEASEFTIHDIPQYGKCGFILVSQSGETKDLQKCLEILENYITIGIINKVDSYIAREVFCGCYLNVGREVGVASTKSFMSQVIMMSLMSLWFSQLHNGLCIFHQKVIQDLIMLEKQIDETIHKSILQVEQYYSEIKEHCYILGKDEDEYIAKEGALKIKELSYIHAEGYSSSSLKHGPYALLKKDFPVILISPKNNYWSKNENIYEEMKSRHANVIIITNEPINREKVILVEENKTYQCLLNVIPLQLFAYGLCIHNHLDPDQPRNLAKVVSVE